jgi:methyl coenzyme M reductase gamma subunit
MFGNRYVQALDEDSAAGLQKLRDKDAEIDAGIDQISRTIDNLTNIGAAMKDEVMNQNAKLEKIDGNMQKTTEKQTVVNARQRYLLK